MEIYHQYIKLRKQFGRWPKFADEGSEMLADIRPNEDHGKEYIPRNPVTTVTQCVPEMSEHDANTNAVILVNKAMSHVEGGWPKDVDYTEAEHTIRYRKKVGLVGCRHDSHRPGLPACLVPYGAFAQRPGTHHGLGCRGRQKVGDHCCVKRGCTFPSQLAQAWRFARAQGHPRIASEALTLPFS